MQNCVTFRPQVQSGLGITGYGYLGGNHSGAAVIRGVFGGMLWFSCGPELNGRGLISVFSEIFTTAE